MRKEQNHDVRGQSRRRLLRAAALGLAAIPVTGCDLFDTGSEPKPGPDPLAPLISDALDLAARYEAAVAAFPELAGRLNPVAQAHRTHAAELARITGSTPPSGTPGASSPSGPSSALGTPSAAAPGDDVDAVLTALRAAERRAEEAATRACLAAPDRRAALVGSIAAARASHQEVLR